MYESGLDRDMGHDSPMQRSRSRSPVRRSRSRSRSPRDWKRNERNQDRMHRSGDSKVRLYVSNIPYETRWQDLKDLFREKVGENVTYVELYDGPDGKPCGAGVVEVRGADVAEKAIETMHRHEVKGRMIVVREERDKDRVRHQKQGGGGNSGGAMGDMGNLGGGMGMNMGMGGNSMMGGNMGNSMNTNMGGGNNFNAQILNQLGIDSSNLTSQVFIANLDYKVTARKLKDIFRIAGTILQCDLKVDKEGKSRGMGICRFEHPMEAVQAISMFNGQVLYDRIMSVRMDKMNDNSNVTPQEIPNKLPGGLKGVGMGLGNNGQPLTNIAQIANALSFSNMSGGNAGNSNLNNMGGNMGNNMGGMGGMGGGNMGNNMGGNMGGMGGNMGGNMGGMGNSMNQGMGGMGGNMQSSMGMGSMGGNSNSFSDMGMSSNMGGGMGSNSMGGGSMGGNMGGSMGGNLGGNMGGSMGMGGSNMGLGNMNDSFSNSMGGSMSSLMNNNMGGSRSDVRGGRGSSMGEATSVFVRNLPFSCSWQTLKEKFRDCGEVRYAEIKMDNGRSKGCGTVRFGSPEDARRAVNLMNGARFEGRQIEVRLDK